MSSDWSFGRGCGIGMLGLRSILIGKSSRERIPFEELLR